MIDLAVGEPYEIEVQYAKGQPGFLGAVRLGCLPPVPGDAVNRAATLAAECDAVLLFVGTSEEWESEGRDREDMELPGEQAAVIERVASANRNTVVVLSSCTPVSMDWLDRVPGVLQVWFPGQECGNAIADVLFGDVNPSGKLPLSFPARLQHNPSFINYPGENGQVRYGEGPFIGYRYYEKKRISPLFCFGHGLSYTSFRYGNLTLHETEIAYGTELRVSLEVTNTGDRQGKETVQLYVRDEESSLLRPDKELKGFAKVALEPGQTETVSFVLTPRDLSYYDPKRRGWIAEAGEFAVLAGSSARDIRARAAFKLTTSGRMGDLPEPASQAAGD